MGLHSITYACYAYCIAFHEHAIIIVLASHRPVTSYSAGVVAMTAHVMWCTYCLCNALYVIAWYYMDTGWHKHYAALHRHHRGITWTCHGPQWGHAMLMSVKAYIALRSISQYWIGNTWTLHGDCTALHRHDHKHYMGMTSARFTPCNAYVMPR